MTGLTGQALRQALAGHDLLPDRAATAPVLRVAKPGDPDLDLNLTGIRLTMVVCRPGHRYVRLRTTPGHDSVALVLEWYLPPSMPEREWADYHETLHRWRDQQAPIGVYAAPGAVTILVGPGNILPFPRSRTP